MGGNKHKNGIVCTFPGCEKTMRTQKFKLHFSKLHLKPGELYTVEHRRRFEVALDDDGGSPVVTSAAAGAVGAAPSGAKMPALQVAAPSPLPPPFHSTQFAPQFAPLDADNAAGSSSEETVSTSSKGAEEPPSPQTSAALARSVAQHQEQQRFGGSATSPMVGGKRQVSERSLTPEIVNADASNGRTSASVSASPVAAASGVSSVAAASTSADLQDTSNAVLAQFIGMLDERFRELIQKMDQVIDGQHEIAELLRRPFSAAESAQLSPADTSGRKRRKTVGDAASDHENGGAPELL